jgi:hypothetical protein
MLYRPNPVNFDGTNDFLSLTGSLSAADSKLFTGSLWARRTGAFATPDVNIARGETGGAHRWAVNFASTDQLIITARDLSAVQQLAIRAATPVTETDTNWHHFMWSIDMASASNRHVYRDGVEDILVVTYTDTVLDFTTDNVGVSGDATGAGKFVGDLAQVYMNFGEFIDLSILSNREKFIQGGGPVDLGADGSLPTGNVPNLFLNGPTATWATNLGTGGGFTENGALTDGTIPLPSRQIILG